MRIKLMATSLEIIHKRNLVYSALHSSSVRLATIEVRSSFETQR